MPKGYWVGHVDVIEAGRAEYDKYRALAKPAVAKYGGRYLIRKGAHTVVEGSWRAGQTLIEFDSYAQALACYHSPEYQAARKHRVGNAEVDFLIVEGVD